jgi:1,4-dihydroxy-2-naphthoate polyprenyltransferase
MAMTGVKLWAKAVRPYAYSASVVPVAIGGLHARAGGGTFSGWRFGVALASGVLLHTAANLWNDYYDFKGGVDRAGGGMGSGVLVQGEMTPARCFRGAAICAALGTLGGLWLAWRAGWGLLGLGLAGLFGAWAYSAGPLSPKHRALGEVWVFLLMGAGMTLGGYMAQSGRFSWAAVAAGVPAALLTTLILYTNNLRDQISDRAAGLHTLPMLFQPVEAKLLALVFLVVPYGLTGLMAGTGQLPQAILLALLTVPWAVRWALGIWQRPVEEKDVVAMAQLHMAFGLLFAAGLWIGR